MSYILSEICYSHQGPKGNKGDRYVQTFDNNSLVTFAEGPQGLQGQPGLPGVPGPPGRKVDTTITDNVVISVIVIIILSSYFILR